MRLIDADALKDVAGKISVQDKGVIVESVVDTAVAMVEEIVNHAPTIEPKRGEWIEDKYTRKCSICGSTYWRRGGDEWNYCPNCGSKNGGEG